MPKATLSSKHQITVPMKIVRGLGLKPGDKLVIEQIEDHVVLLKEPASWADYFTGRLKGVYGETVEEIDRYIREERASWEPSGADPTTILDALAGDENLRTVWKVFKGKELEEPVTHQELRRLNLELKGTHLDGCLERLKDLRAIRDVPQSAQKSNPHYRRDVTLPS